MSVRLTRLADAQLTITVSRAAPGNLAEGVETRLRRAESVEAVESLALQGIEPGLNDLTAEVTATLVTETGDRATLADRLEETFAVQSATVEHIRTPDTGEEAVDAT